MRIGARELPGTGGRTATIDAQDVAAFARRAAATVGRHEALLDRLDAALGDGDHGTNMTTGLQAVVRDLDARPPADGDDVGLLLRRIGHVLLESVGGASGPLYATAFVEAGFALEGLARVEVGALARAFEAGSAGLARRGRCIPGDKTILDAMQPAADALLAAVADGVAPAEAFVRAARGARDGMRATDPLVARRGLALRLGERSRGHRDPGAASCFLLFRAMLDGRTSRSWRRARR